jgi:hypothetical protein
VQQPYKKKLPPSESGTHRRNTQPCCDSCDMQGLLPQQPFTLLYLRPPVSPQTNENSSPTTPAVCYASHIVAALLVLIPILISIYALWVSIESRKYTRAQVELMQEQERTRERERAIEDEWAQKFDDAVSAVQKVASAWTQTPGGQTNTYGLAFPGPDLVPRIERYLIEEKMSRGPVRARQINAAQLRLPIVQETITQVLDCVERFKREWPGETVRLNL